MDFQGLLKSYRISLLAFLAGRADRTAIAQLRQGTLGIGFQAQERAGDRGKKRQENLLRGGSAATNLTVLADPPPRHRAFAAGLVIQCTSVALLIVLPMILPKRLDPFQSYEVVPLVAPPTTFPLAPPKIPNRTHSPELRDRPLVAKLKAPPRRVFEAMKFEAPKAPRAHPAVQTGALSTASYASPTVHNKNARLVQSGGFGDPYGLPGPGDPNKRANIARRGSLGLPVGAGFGNGLGGANGVPGTVAGGRGGGAAPAADVVEILSKPQPVYTEEAKRKHVEGEVLLQVIFRANGQVQVIRVVRGLGYGLDEAAIRAAQQIRFKPAQRHGTPVDFSAIIHIVFQMAY